MMPSETASPLGSLIQGIKCYLEDCSKPSLLNRTGPINTMSNLPGRVRFRCDKLIGNTDAGTILTENLTKIPGVGSVEVNIISGSALILYDTQGLSPELLFTAMLKLLGLEDEFLRTPQPTLAREINAMGNSLNRAVYDLTGGVTDLWTTMFIVFALVGISKLRKDRVAAFPGGVTLLWWVYNSVIKDKPGNV